MAQHSLQRGQTVISALLDLGQALGYAATPEHRLPTGTAAVDVAWLRQRGESSPLVVFEVETRASEGLANNAMKILGRASAGAMKPLHLFHLVVRGGMRSERPVDVAREFAGHNYSVHLLSAPDEPRRLLESVLQVHRRIADHLDGVALARALASPPWPRDVVDSLLQHAEALGFAGLSERAYVVLARDSVGFRASLARRLLALWRKEMEGLVDPPNRYFEPDEPREEPHGSYMADAACEALELGLIAALVPTEGSNALSVLQRWQEFNHIGDRQGEFTGSGTESTAYAVDNLGYMWALIAALMCKVPGARAWCAAQPAALLEDVYEGSAADIPLLATWVMHLSAGVPGCEAIYERARTRLQQDGGVTERWLVAPEPGSPPPDGVFEGIFSSGDQGIAPKST